MTLLLNGEPHAQVDAEPARQHALAVLSASVVVDLDVGFHRWLLTTGIDAARAAAAVDDLRNWREPHEGPPP